MGIRKILAHDIRMKKNPQTKDETFWINADVESHDAEESMAIRTILAHDIRMKKKSTNQGVDFLDCGFLWSYAGPKSNLHGNFINGAANPKIADMLLCFQILCIYRPLKKHAYFDRTFIKF